MDFSTVTKIVIPEGEVTKITSGSAVLWQKATTPALPDTEYSGDVEASMEDVIILYVGERISADDYYNLYVILNGSTTDRDTVVSIVDGTITYGDGSTSTDFSASGASESGRYIDSLEIALDSGYFDGDYSWGFDIR